MNPKSHVFPFREHGFWFIPLLCAGVSCAQTTTTTVLTSSPNPATFGQQVTLTATVSPGSATGKVTYYAGTTFLGVSSLSAGQAVFRTTLLPAGNTSLTARYDGDASDAASLSAVVTQTVKTVAQIGFLQGASYTGGLTPRSVAIGDFNGDGKADLAMADINSQSSDVVVVLGNGDGTFKSPVTYAVGSPPDSVAIGDFNGDGVPDLVAANWNGNNVSVLLGNGDGTFHAAVNYAAGSLAGCVAVADFNRDGKADLAVANYLDGNVSVLLGNGDGTFQSALNSVWGSSGGRTEAPRSTAVGDFNGDGKADLAGARFGNNVTVLLGNGDGTFQAPVNYTIRSNPQFVTVGDLNGDGKPDLATANASSNDVTVLLGNGDGTFQAAVNYPVGIQPSSVAVGDFNGDGKADLVTANYGSTSGSTNVYGTNTVSVLPGNGDGTFRAAVNSIAGPFPLWVNVADLNGDGIADLAVTGYRGQGTVLLGTASPAFAISVDPINGSGSPQTFTAHYSDSQGWTELAEADLLFNSSLDPAGACWVYYLPGSNTLRLINNAGTAAVPGSISPGSAGSLSNTQCTVSNAGAVYASRSELIIPLSITFASGWVGSKSVYALTYTQTAVSSGWKFLGTWTGAGAPAVISVSPINGSGSPQTFTATYAYATGASDSEVDLVFNSSLNSRNACYVYYLPGSNTLRLINDAGTAALTGSINPGTAGSLSNSQCTVANAGAATLSGNNLTLPLNITFSGTFGGTRLVYGYAKNNGVKSGWNLMGTWTATSSGSSAPVVVSVSPINGNGSPQTFNATWASSAGGADLAETDLLFNSSFSATSACWVYYLPGSNTLRLINDAGTGAVTGSINPGSAGSLSNSQCRVSNAGVATISGNNLVLPLTITFAAGFNGTQNVYSFARNNEGLASGWQILGRWTGQ